MFKNYLKSALRILQRQKTYAFINIFGLAVAMATCLLIFLFIRKEWSYDDFHEKQDSIYSLYIQETRPDSSLHFRRLIPLGLPEALARSVAGVQSYVQIASDEIIVVHEGEAFREPIFEVDPTFFEVFSFPVLTGDPRTALNDLNSIVISERIAQKYFGKISRDRYDSLLDKTLSCQTSRGLRRFRISGVMQNWPQNSSLQTDLLISSKNYATMPFGSNDWNGRTSTYLLLEEDQDVAALEAALRPFTALHLKKRIDTQKADGTIANSDDALRLRLQPLRAVHHNPKIPAGYEQPSHDPHDSILLAGIATLILLIACINFTTLTVARATTRVREVGVRKVAGARYKHLLFQFWSEALVVSICAVVAGIALVNVALPVFNQLTMSSLAEGELASPSAVWTILGLVIFVSFIAGGYPALAMTRLGMVSALKGDIKGSAVGLLNRTLVSFQFAASIALMLGAGIMGQQVRFLQNYELGYNADFIVAVRMGPARSAETVEKYRNALSGYRQVRQVVGAGQAFTRSEDTRLWQDSEGVTRISYVYGADPDYLSLFEMRLVAGRNFSKSFVSDPTTGVLVNETLVKEFGIENPVGKPLHGFMPMLFKKPPIILGVVNDFNFKSLHQKVKPAILTSHPRYWARYRNLYIKLRPGALSRTLTFLKKSWLEVAPQVPFDYFFLDEEVQQQYAAEMRWMDLMRIATAIAIVIACMGLFALVSLMIGKRTKEIGIRKVLGASIASLLMLLTRDFVRTLAVSYVIAIPLAWFAMNRWLQDFAYHVEIGLWVFVLAGGLALVIALLTLSTHAIRAALANPVEALKYE